jgi:hypothetical protein
MRYKLEQFWKESYIYTSNKSKTCSAIYYPALPSAYMQTVKCRLHWHAHKLAATGEERALHYLIHSQGSTVNVSMGYQ